MTYSSRVLEALDRHGTPYFPSSAAEISDSAAHVYVITNGPHVLQIGHGGGKRAGDCMRGSLAKRHAKAWICAIAEVAFGSQNSFTILDLGTREESEAVEGALHAAFGIRTNVDAATLLEGLNDAGPCQLEGVNIWLWDRVRQSAHYRRLEPVEQAMAEELHDLITFGTVRIQRTNMWQKTCRGDLLEGNTLQNAGKAYLIPVFEKLTNGYLRYGMHRPSSESFAAVARDYRYQPRRTPFSLDFPRTEGGLRTVSAPAAHQDPTVTSPLTGQTWVGMEDEIAEVGVSAFRPDGSDNQVRVSNATDAEVESSETVFVAEALLRRLNKLVVSDPIQAGSTKYYLRTSVPGLRFEVENPTPKKIREIMRKATGGLRLENKGLTNRNKEKALQFKTQFPCCYLVLTSAWKIAEHYLE